MSNSTNVETNVVQMRFDNKNFEKNVSQTMDSLDKLKKELKFDDSAKSFKSLEENAKKVDFTPLSKGIEKVQASFSFLDTFSATVYHRLSNRLIDIGKKITDSVSTEGMRTGFSQYEEKMNSFKTIQAAASKDFSDEFINNQLKDLTEYANKTIYSLQDMTTNIGKFTNAGVKLDVAVKAIKGVANEAARSGANAQEASRAMYNFAQSLSVGHMLTIDWKSIENANMATQEFKSELIKTGVAMGKLKEPTKGVYKTLDGTAVTVEGLRESLSKKWLTSDVLIKTLERYADTNTEIGKASFEAAQQVNTFHKMMDVLKESLQTNWSRVWETIFGNLEQATELWTSISDAIGNFIDKRFAPLIDMLDKWNKQHGRADALNAIKDILKSISELLKPIGRAFRDIFPKKTVNDLLEMTGALEDFAKKVKPTSEQVKKIQDTFRGLFAAIDILRIAIRAFIKTFGGVFVKILGDALHTIFGVTGSLGDMLVQVRKNVIENKTFYKAFKSITDVLEWVYGGIKKVAGVIWDLVKAVGGLIKENGGFTAIKKWFSGLFDAIKNFSIADIASHIASMFKNLWKIIDGVLAKTFDFYTPMKNKLIEFKNKLVNSKFAQWIVGFYQKIVDGVQKVFNSFREVKTDGVDELNEKTKSKFSIFEKIAGFFKKVWTVIKKVAETIWPLIKGVFNSLKTGIQMLWTGVTENIKNSDMGDAGGLLAGAGLMGLLLGIKNFIKSMTPMFKAITSVGQGFSGALRGLFNILENASKLIKAKILKEIAISILILTASIFVLCTLPKDKIVAATAAIGVLFQGMASVFKAIDGLSSDIDENGDPKAAAKKGTSGAGRLAGAAAMILSLAIAMAVLTIAMKKISSLSTEDITKGMIALGILFKLIESTINGMLEMGQRTRGSKSGDINIAVSGVASMIKALGKAMIYIMAAVAILALVMKKAGVKYAIGAIVLITFVLTVVGRIMKEIMKYTKQSESWATAISGFATMFAIGFIIKEFAAALIIIVGAIAILGFLISKKIIGIGGLLVAIRTIAVVIAVIFAGIVGMVKLADTTEFANVGKVALLVGMVTLFVTAIANMILILSILPGSWAFTGSSVILAVAAAISAIMLALAYLLKQYELSYIDVKAVTTILSSITIAIVAVAAAIAAMSYGLGSNNNVEGMILLILAIAAAISGLVLAIGKFNTIARGIKVFTNALAAVAIAAAGFALAAFLIVEIISKMSKMTDAEIENIGKNFEKFINVISGSLDKILGLVLTFVKETVAAVITTLLSTILATAGDIIDGLIKLCDILMVKSPELVYKIINTLAAILAEVEKNMGPLVTQVVTFIAQLISDVAKAINENAEKIVNAINDIITAITTLVVGSVAKMLGLDEFKGAVNTLIKIIKPFTAYFLAMFAIAKFKKNAKAVETILNALKTKIIKFKNTVKQGGGTPWRDLLGITELNNVFKDKMGVQQLGSLGEQAKFAFFHPLKSLPTLLKGAGIGAAIGAVLGSTVKAFIDAKTDALDATTTWVEDTDKEFGKLVKSIDENKNEIKEKRKELRDAIYGVDTKYDTTNQKIGRLLDVIDQKTGKIKEGKEEEAANLVKDINSVLGDQLVIENNVLKMLDAQGKARKFELEQLQNIIATEKLRDKLEEKKKRKEEIEKKGGELDKAKGLRDEAESQFKSAKTVEQYDAAIKAISDFNEKLHTGKIEVWDDELGEIITRSITDADWDTLKTKINDFNNNFGAALNIDDFDLLLSTGKYNQNMAKYRTEIDDLYEDKRYEYEKQQKTYESLLNEINNYYEAERALEEGNVEAIKRWNTAFTGIYKANLNDAQKEEEADKLVEEVKDAANNARESVYTRITADYEAAMQYYRDLGNLTKMAETTKAYEDYTRKFNETQGTEVVGKDGLTKSDLYGKIEEWAGQGLSKDTVVGKMKELGVDSAEGYLTGYDELMEAKAGISAKKSTDTQLKSEEAAKKIGSPSKLFADEIGKWTGEGILVGMEDAINAYDPTGLTNTLISKLQSSIFPAIAGLTGNSIPFGGVTPVNFGLNQNGSGIYGTDLAVNDTLPYDTHLMNITAILQKHSDNMMNQTNTIIEEIGLLRGDVGDLASHIDDLELRLDGDAIVGGLTPKLNNSLLKYSRRVERGL